ncbi:hypothetical protein [Streptomyces triticirhizae]|uniref:Uncharacterized protein n=1 Tax=Streptomyces triticirhizae TaxID=2483353 RepID=A0A3M2MB76_9ACTN|nr:hypothetical protein [Streptomyces triticirhizae]RMI46751.1 hypothetical protein EBN88_00530 [Streptomyces triticirhizae]
MAPPDLAALTRLLTYIESFSDTDPPPEADFIAAGLDPRLRPFLSTAPHAEVFLTPPAPPATRLDELSRQAARAEDLADLAALVHSALTEHLTQLAGFLRKATIRAEALDPTAHVRGRIFVDSDLARGVHATARHLATMAVVLPAIAASRNALATPDRHHHTSSTATPPGPVTLTPAQQRALEIIDQHPVQMRESRVGQAKISTDIDARISIATYYALGNKGLVRRDTSTSLYHGQTITLTPDGKRALAALRATPRPQPPNPATPPSPPSSRKR